MKDKKIYSPPQFAQILVDRLVFFAGSVADLSQSASGEMARLSRQG
jgi:hypothetical protein